MTEYLSVDEVIAIHDELIKLYGGALGVLDKGLIESALSRARSGYYKTLSEQGAALLQSLTLNHAFVDGNKRTALACLLVFFRLNGVKIKFTPKEAENLIVNKVILEKVSLEKIRNILEKKIQD